METAIIVVSCLITVFINWYIGLMDFFYPKNCLVTPDAEIIEWEEKKAALWTKHY